MIKAIILDLNKVLIDYKKDDSSYLKVLGKSREEFWRGREDYLKQYMLGQIDFNTFLKIMLEKSDIPLEKLADVKKLHEDGLVLVDGIIPIIEKLRQNYKLILLAGEGFDSLNIKLDKFGLRKYFDKFYATCLQEIEKTNPSFYKIILSENNLKPDEVLFIDDRISYLETAQNLGIKTILFTNSEKLEQDLKNIIDY